MIIAVDFDGTCVTHEYPKIGKNIGAEIVLKKLVEKEHKLILYTMRDGEKLEEALTWFEKNNIEIWDANKNPTQSYWTRSPKVYAHFYIDDAAIGAPTIRRTLSGLDERPFIDWYTLTMEMVDRGGIIDIDEAKEIMEQLEKKYPELYDPGVVFGLNF